AVLDELTPGRRVVSFSASFKLRVYEISPQPADGFSFNFAGNLPNAASGSAEQGVGNGFSFVYDAYQFSPPPIPGSLNTVNNGPGTVQTNTSGMKIFYGGTNIASVQCPTWISTNFIPVSITVAANGQVT